MERRLSHCQIESWCGNVLPLRLLGGQTYGTEEILWHSDDPCVQVTAFRDEDGSFTDGVLLTLLAPGTATVMATLDGAVYRCAVTVRARKEAQSGKHLNYYTGDFHDHSCNSHKKAEVRTRTTEYPGDLIRKWKQDNALDFAVISDHADLLNGREYFRGFADAEDEEPMDMVIFPGCEAEVTAREYDRYGVLHKNSGEIVTVNAAGFASTDSWEEFYEKYESSPFAISVFAHPQIFGHSTPGIWNFSLDKNNTPRLKEMARLVEMGNGTDRKSNMLHEYTYSVALDNGFRVSPTCASDSHGPDYDLESFPGRTVIMAPEKTKEAFADAIWSNRVYATASGNVKLFYSVNGIAAPAELPMTEEYRFHVELSAFCEAEDTKPVLCQVISDYGKCIHEIQGDLPDTFDFTVESASARYFYLRLSDRAGRKTWSCPVFTGRPCDEQKVPLTPVDKAGFTAVDELTGKTAPQLINDNPADPWRTERTTASVVIDMGRQEAVAGLSHYPQVLGGKHADNGPNILAQFPSGFRISTSLDGASYTPAAQGIFRVFGGEELIRFPSREARFVKLEIVSTCGAASLWEQYQDANVVIGELTVYTHT